MNIPVEMLLPKKVPQQTRSAILVLSVLETCETMLMDGWSPHGSLAPMIDRVGICNSSLYQYFHAKEGIIVATYEYMFKKILLRTDISGAEREQQLLSLHKFLRAVDEPFYMLWMNLRISDGIFRRFFVDPGQDLKSYRHAHMLGYWGDKDSVTPESVLHSLPSADLAMTSRLGYTKPITQTMYASIAAH